LGGKRDGGGKKKKNHVQAEKKEKKKKCRLISGTERKMGKRKKEKGNELPSFGAGREQMNSFHKKRVGEGGGGGKRVPAVGGPGGDFRQLTGGEKKAVWLTLEKRGPVAPGRGGEKGKGAIFLERSGR